MTTDKPLTAPRLIDANALLEAMNIARKDRPDSPDDLSDYGFWIMDRIIQSAPTVETTDDVLKAIGRHPTLFLVNEKWNAYVMQNPSEVYKGDTPIEAVKKLEASLNPK